MVLGRGYRLFQGWWAAWLCDKPFKQAEERMVNVSRIFWSKR
jgi:hypothetical protein